MLINKETWEKDPQFIYDDDILGKPLDNYPDYYIFTDGSVYSKYKNRFLKPRPNTCGYLYVSLCNEDGVKPHLIHRLVAIAFIQNPYNYNEVDHIDRDKSNNNLSNLRWLSHIDNMQNQGISKNNKCGIKNISYDKRDNLWRYTKMIKGNTFAFFNKNKNIVLWCKFVHYLIKPAF